VRTTSRLGADTDATTLCPNMRLTGAAKVALTQPLAATVDIGIDTRASTRPLDVESCAVRFEPSEVDARHTRIPVTVTAFFITKRLPTLSGLAICATTRPEGWEGNSAPTLTVDAEYTGVVADTAWAGPATSQLRIMTRNVLNSFMTMFSSRSNGRLHSRRGDQPVIRTTDNPLTLPSLPVDNERDAGCLPAISRRSHKSVGPR